MYMAIPRSFSSFLAAYLGRVPPGRPFSTDHEVKENPIQKSITGYKLIPRGELQHSLHVSLNMYLAGCNLWIGNYRWVWGSEHQ